MAAPNANSYCSRLFIVKNVGWGNFGDLLMVEALTSEINKRLPGSKFLLPEGTLGVRLLSTPNLYLEAPIHNTWKSILPGINREQLLMLLSDRGHRLDSISGIFDVNGFYIGEQWSPRQAKKVNLSHGFYAKHKKPIILLPKSFGPFGDRHLDRRAYYARSIVRNSLKTFCRDESSLKNLLEVCMDEPQLEAKIERGYDFTGDLKPLHLSEYGHLHNRPAIILNPRMVDKVGSEQASAYLQFIADLTETISNMGSNPFFLVHAEGDQKLLERIKFEREYRPEVVCPPSALAVKGVIGRASLVVSARLHGIINALSQGVPTIGTGWSHKYAAVFQDYGCESLMIGVDTSRSDIREKLEYGFALKNDLAWRAKVGERQRFISGQNKAMWDCIAENFI